MRDPFKHFEGGKEGVRSRFASRIRGRLRNLRNSSVFREALLEEHLGLREGTLQEIDAGKDEQVTWPVIEALAAPLGMKLDDGFGRFIDFTEQDEEMWAREAAEDRFTSVGWANGGSCTPSQRVKLFILLRALREL